MVRSQKGKLDDQLDVFAQDLKWPVVLRTSQWRTLKEGPSDCT